jgi:choline dehydrogenase-like flavoprotein
MDLPDYVVVGAGSAGCALAARLTEDPDVRVVVLEAGGPDSLEAIGIPAAWPTMWGTEVDWAYETTPQAGSAGQIHQWPRGKVIGGSSSLNGMVYIRGNPADFDAWAYDGCDGWDHASLLPLFKRMEDVPDGDPAFRGTGGPIVPRPAATPNPISTAFVEAAREVGHPVTEDFNGEQFEGAGFHDLLIKDGRRTSAAVTYVGLVGPASRGTVRLRSTSLGDKPLIDPAYLAEEADVEAMVRGTKLARELASAAAFDPWRGEEVLPGESVQTDAELEDFVRHAAGSYFHPVGTCRMGVGPDAVVDPSLRVRGLEGLRVADASVMPSIVSANTNTAAMIIGERAADLLRGTSPTPVSPGQAVVGA